jgi:phosphohistidine swiveling domain-containing protein
MLLPSENFLFLHLFDSPELPSTSVLGAKGKRLIEMYKMGIPVPPGFILKTSSYKAYQENNCNLLDVILGEILTALRSLELKTGKNFGDPNNPLLLSARSGPVQSMPGILTTILNLGLSQEILATFLRSTKNQVFVDGLARNFQLGFSDAVLEQRFTNTTSVSDPFGQLKVAIEAIFSSWNSSKAVEYRKKRNIVNDLGTSVIIQPMVLGNKNSLSGSGVVFSRNQVTGEKDIFGDFLPECQGIEVVNGRNIPLQISELKRMLPDLYLEIKQVANNLERLYKAVQDIEFTYETGQLWILQSRNAVPHIKPFSKMLVDMVEEGILDSDLAVKQAKLAGLNAQFPTSFDFKAKADAKLSRRYITSGIPGSNGVAVGEIVFDPTSAELKKKDGISVIYLCIDANPEDTKAIFYSDGIVTSKGGASSHFSIIARQLGRPCILGCKDIIIDVARKRAKLNEYLLREGDIISIDGSTGEVFLGIINITSTSVSSEIKIIQEWSKHQIPWAVATRISDWEKVKIIRKEILETQNMITWQTDKAKVVELLSRVVPEKYFIKKVIVDAKDRDKLLRTMLDVIHRGFWTGPRTCHHPDPQLGKASWQLAIQTEDEVRDFINNENFRLGTASEQRGSKDSGGYLKWIQDDCLKEIIVSYDAPRKGLTEFNHEHFVCTVFPQSNPDCVIAEVYIGSPYLRSLESADASELFHCTLFIDPQKLDNKGSIKFTFGNSYFDANKIINYLSKLRSATNVSSPFCNSTNSLEYELFKKIMVLHPQQDWNNTSSDGLVKILLEGMNVDEYSLPILGKFITEKTLLAAQEISKIIFEEWWCEPFELPITMQALHEASGLYILEMQGHLLEDGHIDYMMVYGAKGLEERSIIEKQQILQDIISL